MQDFNLRISEITSDRIQLVESFSKATGEIGPIEISAPSMSLSELAGQNDARLRTIGAEFSLQVLPGPIWQAWQASLAAAGNQGVRFRVRCADVNCAQMPWELLYDPDRKTFLAQDPRSPIVRYVEGPISSFVSPIEGAVRMLLTCASPTDDRALAVDVELDRIEAALSDAVDAGRVEVTRIDDLTLDALEEALLKTKPHVFHFSGHGEWSASQGAGFLKLDDGAGKTEKVTDVVLAMLLKHRGVALAVLNACDTAVAGHDWMGLAQSLVLAEIPSVIAMQMPVSDRAASAFAATLYTALANDHSLERSVTAARQTIARQRDDVAEPGEWLAPALFMRTGSEQFWIREQQDKPQIEVPGISIGKIVANNVAETQIIDMRDADITVGDKQIDTGGGAYIGGNVSVGGDFVGRDKIGSESGKDNSDTSLQKAFTKLAAGVALDTPTADVDKAIHLVTGMQQALLQRDEDKVADCITDLANLVPACKDAIRQAFSDPTLNERAGPVTKYALRRMG